MEKFLCFGANDATEVYKNRPTLLFSNILQYLKTCTVTKAAVIENERCKLNNKIVHYYLYKTVKHTARQTQHNQT